MNGEDSFESRLKRQPQRQVPAAWRNEILAAGCPAEPPRPSWIAQWLWPHPTAWAALAAAWLLVIGMNIGMRDTSPSAASHVASRPSRQVWELLLQQEQMLAELNGPADNPQRPVAVPMPPQPRSQRREDFLYA